MDILFIDDDFMSIEPTTEFLKLEGHDIDIVNNVQDALDRYTCNCYDIVFLDIMFAPSDYFTFEETAGGRYTGLKLLEEFRKIDDAKLRPIKIVMITNWRNEPQVEASCNKNNAAILRKPLSIESIKDVLDGKS